MKKNIVTVLALILAAASLISCLLIVFKSRKDLEIANRRYEELNVTNRHLEEQVKNLTAQLEAARETEAPAAPIQLHSWTLDVAPWADSTGADISLNASVDGWQEELSAQFLVQLEGQEIVNTPCQWDGESFFVTAALDAADGYGYFLVLNLPDGTQEAYTLTTPSNPTLDIPVYLASSLSAYCNLVVSQWQETEEGILLDSAYVHVQLPRITPGDPAAVENAQLVLSHNGTDIHQVPITLQPGEMEGGYELPLSQILLPLPETATDDMLELRLEVSTTSAELSAIGISWWRTEAGLDAVVG